MNMKNNGIDVLVLILLLLLPSYNYAVDGKKSSEPIKVAVIDTGFDFKSKWTDAMKKGLKVPKLCKEGHKDFTGEGLQDTYGHGTHVAGIIGRDAGDSNYCLLILKAMSPYYSGSKDASIATAKAFEYAIQKGAKIINYSAGGKEFVFKEYLAVKKALDAGVIVVAAAGNDSKEINQQVLHVNAKYKYQTGGNLVVYNYEVIYIDKKTLKISKYAKNTYFPAAYDARIISVMNYANYGFKVHSSNYGAAFNYKGDGRNVYSLKPNESYGFMTGTSQAVPQKVAEIIKNWEL